MAIVFPVLTPPGGSTTQVQYNNAGSFGGTSGLTWSGTALSFATNQELQFRATGNRAYSSAADTLDVEGNVTLNLGKTGADATFGGSSLLSFKPQTTEKGSLGTSSLRWFNIFMGGDIDIDGGNIFDTSGVGIKLMTGSTQLLGFWGATPVARASAYTQTFSTASRTVANNTSSAVATTASTNVAPFGYTTSAQADAIVTAINALRTDVDNAKKAINQVIDDMQTYGILA